jgi:hypothetical protein
MIICAGEKFSKACAFNRRSSARLNSSVRLLFGIYMKLREKHFMLFRIAILCTFTLTSQQIAQSVNGYSNAEVDNWFCANGIVTSKGAPIEGVDVSLHIEGSTGDSERPHQTTNSEGKYSFVLCCSGENTPYSLAFLKSGFKPLTFEGTSDCSAVKQIEMILDNEKQPNNSLHRTLTAFSLRSSADSRR